MHNGFADSKGLSDGFADFVESKFFPTAYVNRFPRRGICSRISWARTQRANRHKPYHATFTRSLNQISSSEMMDTLERSGATLVNNSNQVDHCVASRNAAVQILGVDVSFHLLKSSSWSLGCTQQATSPHERSYGVSLSQQSRKQVRTHESSGTGQKDSH